MPEYSEATKRVLERSLELLREKLPEHQVTALRALLDAGRLDDLPALEAALEAKAEPHD